MAQIQKPRAFLSYRHEESESDEQVNTAHRAWVSRLAKDLGAHGIEIIWDQTIRDVVSKHVSIDPFEVPLCQEFSRISPLICNVFVPIITPAYLERLGWIEGKKTRSIPYGVIFEEWQGAAFLAQSGLLKFIPVIRRGRAHQLNLTEVVNFTIGAGLIDLRGNDPSLYEKNLARLAESILGIDISRNMFLSIDIQTLCDVYIEWSRIRFPNRVHAPVDIWPFHTGAANEFLGAVRSQLADASLENWEIDAHLMQWQTELTYESRKAGSPLQYTEVIEFTSLALKALKGDRGWGTLEKTAEFCKTALKTLTLQGDPLDRSRALNNTGLALLRIATRQRDLIRLHESIDHFRGALKNISREKHAEEWIRIQTNLADAVRSWGDLENDTSRLREAQDLYETIAQVSAERGDQNWRDVALKAIDEIRDRLKP